VITFEELAQRFPIRNVAPYGACVVVPGVEFDPDWEVYLGDQGCRCIMTDLDGAPVTLVQRKNVTGQGMRDVYVPSQAKEAFPNCAFCGSSNVKKYGIRHNRAGDVQRFFCNDCGKKFSYREDFGFKMKHSNKIIQFAQQLASQTDPAYSLRDIAAEIKKRFGVKVSHNAIQRWLEPEKKESGGGMESMENKESTKSTKSKKGGFKGNPEHLWKPEENELLIALWNRKPKLTKAKIIKEFRIKFPNRSPGSFSNHLWVLQQAGKIERRFSMKRKGSKAPKEEKVAAK
jgi:transposase-like protein